MPSISVKVVAKGIVNDALLGLTSRYITPAATHYNHQIIQLARLPLD